MKKHAAKTDLYVREKRIATLIASGMPRRDICMVVAEEFNISPRTVERNYYSVVDELAKETWEQRTELRATLQSKLETIYKTAVEDGNLRAAIDACNSQARIGGLFEQRPEQQRELPTVIELSEGDFRQIEGETNES